LAPVPDLSHLWQRFLLATALLFGLLVGVVATVFGYSNVSTVNVHWSIFHLDGVPLWSVAVVPLAVFLVAGTLYHWSNSLHHFTEHMRHRRRVHELEAELTTLRQHLDHVLEMPDHSTSRLPAKHVTVDAMPVEPVKAEPVTQAALPEASPSNGSSAATRRSERRKTEPAVIAGAAAKAVAEPAVEPLAAAVAEPASES
jgi:hypothetical protein